MLIFSASVLLLLEINICSYHVCREWEMSQEIDGFVSTPITLIYTSMQTEAQTNIKI